MSLSASCVFLPVSPCWCWCVAGARSPSHWLQRAPLQCSLQRCSCAPCVTRAENCVHSSRHRRRPGPWLVLPRGHQTRTREHCTEMFVATIFRIVSSLGLILSMQTKYVLTLPIDSHHFQINYELCIELLFLEKYTINIFSSRDCCVSFISCNWMHLSFHKYQIYF